MSRQVLKYIILLLSSWIWLSTTNTYAQCGLDVFIANDQSGSVDAVEDMQSRSFITNLMGNLEPWGNGNGQSRMAIAQWDGMGSWQQFAFPVAGINYTTSLSDVIDYEISNRILFGGTDPYYALLKTYNAINQTPVAGRTAKQVIVLMTDATCGQIQDGIVNLATQIKDEGIQIIVLAIDYAQSCTILQGTNVASPGGYFSAASYAALEASTVSFIQQITQSACIGPQPPVFDLQINLSGFNATNCINDIGTYKVDYNISNIGKAAYNNNITISFYNGDPTLSSSQFITKQNIGTQNIAAGGSIPGSFTSPLLGLTYNLYAIVNFDGTQAANAPPLPYNILGQLSVPGERYGYNNFSNPILKTNDASCKSKAILNVSVNASETGCNNTVNYEIEVCNTGDAIAIIDDFLPTPPPGFSLINTTNVRDSTLKRIWGTYFGGTQLDVGTDVTTDIDNYIYVIGYSLSDGMASAGAHQITRSGSHDHILVKFDSQGNRLWSTYYGGINSEINGWVKTDKTGNVYVCGRTRSPGNISTPGSQQPGLGGNDDIYLVKFNKNGVRQWATYYGGVSNDEPGDFTIDDNGNIYIVGQTQSNSGFSTAGTYQPVFNGGTYDAFLLKFNNSGILQWSTYYGGAVSERFYAVDLDNAGNIYAAGNTNSPNNIATAGAFKTTITGDYDGMVVKFNSLGFPIWGTYYGGDTLDAIQALIIDHASNVYIGGFSKSLNNISTPGTFQTVANGVQDGFIAKFNSNGQRLWATYYGGTDVDIISEIDINTDNNLLIYGTTFSLNNIATANSFQTSLRGSQDAFIGKLTPDGQRLEGTYYGGNSDEAGTSLSVNKQTGDIYIAGWTSSNSFMSTAGTFQFTYSANTDYFLTKFRPWDNLFIQPNECITRQYTYRFGGVPAGTYDYSYGLIAQKYVSTDANPVILPDSNFNAGPYTNIDGFNGSNHTTDNVVITGNTAACTPGDQVSVTVNIPPLSSCGGHYAKATVTINNSSGLTLFNPYLYLNLSGTNSQFAGEIYNLSNNLLIPLPNILSPLYPGVNYALYGKTGIQILPIYRLPPGISSFNIDIDLGTATTNLAVRIDSLPDFADTSGSSNLASDAQGINIPAPPTINGFNCPVSITAGNNITFSGLSTTNTMSVKWASTTVATIPNGGSVNNPSLVYTPTPTDIANGFVAISLMALNSAGCDVTKSCQIDINNAVYDYGDAPINYDLNKNAIPYAAASTLLPGINLGALPPTSENTSKNSVDAKGDGQEEDGLTDTTCVSMPIANQGYSIGIKATNTTPNKAFITAFIDWNNDGDYIDDSERVKSIILIPSGSGTQNYTADFVVASDLNASVGQYFIRLRISTDSNSIKNSYKPSPQGEIEDHIFKVGQQNSNTNLSYTICQGDSIKVATHTYKLTGIYKDTLPNSIGCDSIITTNLTVNPKQATAQSIEICSGQSFNVGIHNYTQTGTYKDTLKTSKNCDSIITTNLTVNPKQSTTQSAGICPGETFNVGIHNYSQAGTYKDTLKTSKNCDSIITTTITIVPAKTFQQQLSICPGSSVIVGIHTYTVSGTYIDSLQSANGCDSIVTTDLIVNPIRTITQNVAICNGGSFTVGSHTYSSPGTYKDTLKTSKNCDSIITTTITTIPAKTFQQQLSICQGNSIQIGTHTYTASGTYIDSLKTTRGCDSIVTTDLIVNPVKMTTQNIAICTGASFTVGSHTYSSPGTYKDTLKTSKNCDSIITTTITIVPAKTFLQQLSICQGGSVTVGIHTYTISGAYTDSLKTANGCDSIVTTNLIVNPLSSITQNATICAGGSFTIGTHTYTSPGTYIDTLKTIFNCDSIVTTTITQGSNQSVSNSYTICNGENITVNNHTYSLSGIYKDTIAGVQGCDTIITTDLTVNSRPIVNLGNDQNICPNTAATLDAGNTGAFFQWNTGAVTQTITTTSTGTYIVKVTQNNCGSYDTINVFVRLPLNIQLGTDTALCYRDSVILDAFTPDGTYMWQDGSAAPYFFVSKDGLYSVIVTTDCETVSDDIQVTFIECECEYYLSSAFTPNGDGLNDAFGALNSCISVQAFRLSIYNRWGQLVYENENQDKAWDGSYLGVRSPMDDYVYVISYRYNDRDYVKKGTVTLVR